MNTVIEAGRHSASPMAVLREYLEFGSLLKHLTLRDLRIRYRRTALGVLWVVLQPLVSTLIFAVVFSRVLRLSTEGVPYSLFALAGFVPWSFFSSCVGRAATIYASHTGLMSKVYFPRGILPASTVLGSALDLVVGCLMVFAYSIWSGYWPTWRWLLLPAVAVQAVLVTFFVSLGLAILTAVKRDLKHAIPFVTQAWMYATPVVYPASLISGRWAWLFGLNPMTGVLDGFRWCFFGTPVDPMLYWSSAASTIVLAAGSLKLFYDFERTLVESA